LALEAVESKHCSSIPFRLKLEIEPYLFGARSDFVCWLQDFGSALFDDIQRIAPCRILQFGF
jgi:hypothetical protein